MHRHVFKGHYRRTLLALLFVAILGNNVYAQPLNIISPAIVGGTQTSPIITTPTITGGTESGTFVDGALSVANNATSRRTDSDKKGDMLTPADFLAVGQTKVQILSGTIDATSAVQAAWNSGNTYLPCGQYKIAGLLTASANNATLRGAGAACVAFLVTSTSGDVITVSGKSNVHISGIQFLATVPRTSGAAIHLIGSGSTIVDDIKVEVSGTGSTWFDIFNVDAASAVTHISRFYFANASNTCFYITGYSIDTYIDSGNTTACGTGMSIDSASGIYPHDIDLVGSVASGLNVSPVSGHSVNALRGSNILSDTSQGAGAVFSGAGAISEVDLTNLWVSASGTSGVFTSGQTLNQPASGLVINAAGLNGAIFTGLRAKGNGAHGVDIEAGYNISFSSPQVFMNGASYGTIPPGGSTPSTTRYNGFEIGTGVSNLSFMGPIAGQGGWELANGLTQKQGYGMAMPVAGPSGTIITVIGGQFNGNVTGTCTFASGTGESITVTPGC